MVADRGSSNRRQRKPDRSKSRRVAESISAPFNSYSIGNRKARADRCFHTIEYGFPVTLLDPKKLVEFVNFDADVLADLQRHKDELAICCRIKNRSECDIRLAESFNVCYKSAQGFIPNFR